MDTLGNYYNLLADWEKKPVVDLIAPWLTEDVQAIAVDFEAAFRNERFQADPLLVPLETTNQSLGNKVAEFVVRNINPFLRHFKIQNCTGAGYPDKYLLRLSDSRMFVFELKATSQFDVRDSNRIVLTSSSGKLRKYFHTPINHILATACYCSDQTEIRVQNLRLDFLEPSTPVNVRLEASVSQKLLSDGTHANFQF